MKKKNKHLDLPVGSSYRVILTEGVQVLPCTPLKGGRIVSLPNYSLVTYWGECPDLVFGQKILEFSTSQAKDTERFGVIEGSVEKYFHKIYVKNRF